MRGGIFGILLVLNLFKVQYYKEGNERGRAKKLLYVKYEDLLEKLVYTYTPNNDDEEVDEEYALVDLNEDDEADSDSASTSEEESDEDSLCF